jgi:hypothetical protein
VKYLICALIVTGCAATTSEIVPAGKDSYLVTGSVAGTRSGEGVAALKAANAYCEKLGKHMQIRREETGYSLDYRAMNLIFSCLDANDPEYQRPDLRRDPTTIIEDQRKR